MLRIRRAIHKLLVAQRLHPQVGELRVRLERAHGGHRPTRAASALLAGEARSRRHGEVPTPIHALRDDAAVLVAGPHLEEGPAPGLGPVLAAAAALGGGGALAALRGRGCRHAGLGGGAPGGVAPVAHQPLQLHVGVVGELVHRGDPRLVHPRVVRLDLAPPPFEGREARRVVHGVALRKPAEGAAEGLVVRGRGAGGRAGLHPLASANGDEEHGEQRRHRRGAGHRRRRGVAMRRGRGRRWEGYMDGGRAMCPRAGGAVLGT
mmetsp:Transcript_80556/g.203686  ORF Transcript_80556/g.203686 Transcript_80556/m.203686 type:complete len:263 (+) Transcript_80556:846-1634(+)